MWDNGIRGKNKKKWTTKATGRDYTKQKAYNKTPAQKKKRAELNAEARKRGVYWKRHKKWVDLSHKKNGKMVLEKRSTNRARNGKNWKSTKK